MGDRNAGAPHTTWTADEWRARADHAQAYLDTDPTWKVGADVVAYFRRQADRMEHAPCPRPDSTEALPVCGSSPTAATASS